MRLQVSMSLKTSCPFLDQINNICSICEITDTLSLPRQTLEFTKFFLEVEVN